MRQDHGIAFLAELVDRRDECGVRAHRGLLGQDGTSLEVVLTSLRVAIAGDLHGDWGERDADLIQRLQPDALLFVGDLSDGDLRLVKSITQLSLPVAVLLGNHDRGRDRSGGLLQQQITMLGDRHCSWKLREWSQPELAVVGARPCSAGGGFHLSKAVQAVFGPVTETQSAGWIVDAAGKAPVDWPLVVLAHSGPTGLGSEANSPCGRDWKQPHIDWGDRDLALALDRMQRTRPADLVVFGHMHHQLKGRRGERITFHRNRQGTCFVNAACVPRVGVDGSGQPLHHFTWVEFAGTQPAWISHRWYRPSGELTYEQPLLRSALSGQKPC
ncbi:MAG: 3',5'-cyclic adenosine monophosphate phosphodiesterase CpdA [Cyanobium sp. ARS6]|nr:MAG: 3',5'-cyclic adenosine monophosphate phosphodiesterase CpdA [Cyanobium sp. ARS6]